MSKTFRAWKIDEPQFLPPSVQDFVAKDHLAGFVVSLVSEQLDWLRSRPATPPRRASHHFTQ